MCEIHETNPKSNAKTISVEDAVGTILAHDITEITPGQFKGCAFRKGHVIKPEDVSHLQKLGKEHLFVLDVKADEMHEDEAARALADALMGDGVKIQGEPKEGKINIIAGRSGLLKIDTESLRQFNMSGDIMCATLHNNTVVQEGRIIAGTRAIPLVVKKRVIESAVAFAKTGHKTIEVKEIRKPKAGVVITGNEVYYGRIQDAFGPVIKKKIEEYGGEVRGMYFAPDDESYIEARLRELIAAGCDLLITTGGMSVDPDDVTRFAIRNLGASDITYGSAVLPGAMFLVATIEAGVRDQGSGISKAVPNPQLPIPLLGIPACGMYHKTTIFDLVLPRVLAGEQIGRKELAELGHGGLCMNCEVCHYPVCPFGKG
ncbi:MAG: molybdopterin-binding protein [Nitrospirae bacterium]|nr:molybdopterin-binding protein [Nitrospirota bacterium]